jgi:phosphoribosylamine--glycine ligase
VAGEHFEGFDEAMDFAAQSIEKFGRVVLEKKLVGEEFSLISIVDGETVLDCPAIQDHKRAFEGDEGPNTGGMGCVSDENGSLPFLTRQDLADAHAITESVMHAVKKETNETFVGVMYGGFMVTKNGVKLIEYNARFGDPEALNILPILETDFVDVCEKAIAGELDQIGELGFKPVATVVKYLCPEGYPTDSVKNVPIEFTGKSLEGFYFASVGEENGEYLLKGSRAVGVLGTGKNMAEAKANCDAKLTQFKGPLFYRHDIGSPELMEKRIEHMKTIRG